MISRAAGARRDPRVLWRRTLDGAILLPPVGEAVRLNGSAAAVWMLLDRWRTVEDLVVALVEHSGASAEVVAADVAPLLRELVAAGLATDVPA